MSPAVELGLAAALVAWVTVVAVVSGVAIVRALMRRRQPAPRMTPDDRPAVVVLRPCAGLEPHLARSLGSTAALRYGGPLRVIFGTTTASDPARPVLEQIAAMLRAQGLDVTVGVFGARGANLKSSQLAGMLEDAADDVALVIDSDVELEDLELDRMLAPLGDRADRVAAVWCPPVEREPRRLGDRMSAALLGGSLHAFTLLGGLDPRGLVGKTFAIRLDALRSVGGFGDLVQHLGEDMELARRLRAKRWHAAMNRQVVTSLASGRSVGQVLARYARWLMVIRAQRPALLASYPLLLAATPGLLLASGLGWSHGLSGAGLVMATAVGVRLLVGLTASVAAGRSPSPGRLLTDALLADALLLTAFARAAFGPARVQWRGQSLRLGTRGRLRVVEPSPASPSLRPGA